MQVFILIGVESHSAHQYFDSYPRLAALGSFTTGKQEGGASGSPRFTCASVGLFGDAKTVALEKESGQE
jgi:hypothetical protein